MLTASTYSGMDLPVELCVAVRACLTPALNRKTCFSNPDLIRPMEWSSMVLKPS